jgi:hypothetical protein
MSIMSGITSRRWAHGPKLERGGRGQAIADVVVAIAALAVAAVVGGLAVGWVLSKAVLVLLGLA